MLNDYFSKSRSRFLSPGEPILCLGTGFDAKSITDTGGVIVPWGTEVPGDEAAKFGRVFLCPTQAEAGNAQLPKFLAGLGKIGTILLPHTLVPQLSNEALPSSVACLQLVYDSKFQPRDAWDDVRWPDIQLRNVAGLFQRTNQVPSTNWTKSGLAGERLPNLKFLSCEMEGLQRALLVVQTFSQLQHLELENVKKTSIWPQLPPTLEALKLTQAATGFSFNGVGSLPALQTLAIFNARCEIDCEIFSQSKQLVEVSIVDSKKLKNLDALLEHATLRSIRFLDCGKPFTEALKARFKAQGFERIEIDFA
jgi:hypothetical protein